MAARAAPAARRPELGARRESDLRGVFCIPGRVAEIIPIRPAREEEKWIGKASEEVMETASFGRLRAHIWKLLRQQMQPNSAKTSA